jgi:hypothetical protein
MGVSVQHFTLAEWVYALFLRPLIESRVFGLMGFRNGSDSECVSNLVQNSGKNCDGKIENDQTSGRGRKREPRTDV